MSVDVPIGISDSFMFRNIYDDSICIYKTPIIECMENSKEYLKKYKKEYSHNNSITFIESYLLS